jgi:hypothetical protein
LFFEKTVKSFPELMREVEMLDLDSGIRTYGDIEGKKKQFVFVTRSLFHDGYILMVYSKKREGKVEIPDKRLLAKEFRGKEELGRFMAGLLSRPVKAFVY